MEFAGFLYISMMFVSLILMLMDKLEVRVIRIDKKTGEEIKLPEIFRYILILCLSIVWPVIPVVNMISKLK